MHIARPAHRVSSEILDRIPPQNLEAERGVLGSILLDAAACDLVAPVVKAEDFYSDANQRVYGHALALYDAHRAVDVALLAERLKRAGEFEAIGGAEYLIQVVQSVPYAANAAYYAEIVREKALRRRVIHAATSMLRDAYDEGAPINDVVSDCEAALQKVPTGEFSGDPITFAQAVGDAGAHVDDIFLRKRSAGVMTGLITFDIETGGLFGSELTLLAARPSVGKSAAALQIAQNVAGNPGDHVYYGSLEMQSTELALRVLCGQSGVALSRVRSARIGPADIGDLSAASRDLAGLTIWLHDRPRMTVQDIRRACRRLASQVNLRLVVVDYLQRVAPADRSVPRHLQVGQMTADLKALAMELKVPVLCLAQLSRQAEERDKKTGLVREPRLADLKESGDIEQDADVVVLLHRQQRARDAKLILAKNRQGEQATFNLVFDGARIRFECGAVTTNGGESPEDRKEF
jgi:replicative DNA helicase